MGRHTQVWGEDASEYKPSRWLDEEGELIRQSQFKFHAFNGGARTCLGINLILDIILLESETDELHPSLFRTNSCHI